MRKLDILSYYEKRVKMFENEILTNRYLTRENLSISYGELLGMVQIMYAGDIIGINTYLAESNRLWDILGKGDMKSGI